MNKKVKRCISIAFVCVFTFLIVFTGYKPAYRVYAADEDFTPSPSPVIVEQFTGGWCGACPIASASIDYCDRVFNRESDVFVSLAYHYRDVLATSETTQRNEYYNVNQYPTVYVEGVEKMGWGNSFSEIMGIYQNTIEQCAAQNLGLRHTTQS